MLWLALASQPKKSCVPPKSATSATLAHVSQKTSATAPLRCCNIRYRRERFAPKRERDGPQRRRLPPQSHHVPESQDVVAQIAWGTKKTACPSKVRYIRYIGSNKPEIIRYSTVTLPIHPLQTRVSDPSATCRTIRDMLW